MAARLVFFVPRLESHQDELKDYDIGKGTIRFQAEDPLPSALVRNLVEARIAENGGADGENGNEKPHQAPKAACFTSKMLFERPALCETTH